MNQAMDQASAATGEMASTMGNPVYRESAIGSARRDENFDGFDDYYTAIPYLDVFIVHDAQAQRVVINVVNRHKDEAIATDLMSIPGTATVTQIPSDDISNAPYTYAPTVGETPTSGSTLHYSFPAHSFTPIVVSVEAP